MKLRLVKKDRHFTVVAKISGDFGGLNPGYTPETALKSLIENLMSDNDWTGTVEVTENKEQL